MWNLTAGLAVYLVGDTLYRGVLLIAALAFVTVPLGFAFGVLLLPPLWIVDRAQEKRARWGAAVPDGEHADR